MRKQGDGKILLSALCMLTALATGLTGCGRDQKEKQEGAAGSSLDIYTAEAVELPLEGQGDYVSQATFVNGKVYYVDESYENESARGWVKYLDVKEGGAGGGFSLDLEEDVHLLSMDVDGEGNVYLTMQDSSQVNYNENTGEISGNEKLLIQKRDGEGNILLEQDITSLFKTSQDEYAYVQNMCVDAGGNIYLQKDQTIILLDEQGGNAGQITVDNWVNAMGKGPDGSVYVSWWGDQGGMILGGLDFQAKRFDSGKTYSGLPGGNGNWGLDGSGNFLFHDDTRLYRYKAGEEKAEAILDWIDSDISGMNISCVGEIQEGKLAVVQNHWNDERSTSELVVLSKAEGPVEKEIITLGVLFQGSMNQEQIVRFNRANDKYRIRVKYYIDNNTEWSETTYTDGMKAMSADILSGNGPDLFGVDGLDLASLSAKGAFEDLYPYLDRNEGLGREDLLANVLEAYTYDGRLTSIPMSFFIETMAAKTSLVGDRKGWTMDDVIALTDAHPDAEVIQYASKSIMLQYLLQNSVAEFVDNEKGTCNFHDPEFVKLLEYINRFPEEVDFEAQQEESFVGKLREDRLLLYNVYLGEPEEIGVTLQVFGEEPISFIGYPTADGENGTFLNANGLYAIASKSAHKDGAWEFLRTALMGEASETGHHAYGFPVRHKALEDMLAKAQEDAYVLDEEGNVLLDEEGNPVKQVKGGISFGNSDAIETYAPTDEELELVRELIQRARPRSQMDTQIMNIIAEECQSFFLGQKSGEAVADIIQSRVQLYISENR